MFNRLLVGLDGSAGSEAALREAIELGRRFHGTMVLAAVSPNEVRGRALLEAAGARAKAAGLEVETTLAAGDVEEELLRLAEQVEALVVGRRGEEHGAPGEIGATTARVVHRSPKPVVVAGDALSPGQRPVVGYDGGETSAAALALAARYAEVVGVPLDVVHVGGDPREAAELLARAAAFLSSQNTTYITHALEGDVTDALAGYVARASADLLVLGAHGGRRRSHGVGSHAEALLRATPVPVIISR